LLVYAFGGGPHSDVSGKWWYQGPVTAVVALAMWWAVLEGCRRFWNERRRWHPCSWGRGVPVRERPPQLRAYGVCLHHGMDWNPDARCTRVQTPTPHDDPETSRPARWRPWISGARCLEVQRQRHRQVLGRLQFRRLRYPQASRLLRH